MTDTTINVTSTSPPPPPSSANTSSSSLRDSDEPMPSMPTVSSFSLQGTESNATIAAAASKYAKEKQQRRSKWRLFCSSVGTMFTVVLMISLAGTAAGVWEIWKQLSSQPIADMSTEIKTLTTQRMVITLEEYFGTLEKSVEYMANQMVYNAAPYWFDPNPNIEHANAMVWAAIHSTTALNSQMSYVWIMNVMAGPYRAAGYSYRGTPDTWTWFGTWDYENLTGGENIWQVRRYLGQVDPDSGIVNYTAPPSWSAFNGTQWPGVLMTTFSDGQPHTWYVKNNPLVPNVDTVFPDMGIQFTYITGFFAEGERCLASATITSKYLIDFISTIDVKKGIMYLADDLGYIYAVSEGVLPITGNATKYQQYNSFNYPDQRIKTSADVITSIYSSYANIPSEILIHDMIYNGKQYTLTTSTFVRYNLRLHIITVIPESSFVGFTQEIQNTLTWVVSVIVLGVGILSIIMVVLLITIPINREIGKLNSWVNADERDPNSLFYKSTRTLIEKKYPQARDEVTEVLSQRVLSLQFDGKDSNISPLRRKIKHTVGWFGKTLAPYEVKELREAGKASRNAMKSFSAYIPRSVVRTLVTQREVAKPNMVLRNLSIYFSDIEDYTGIVTAFKNDSALVNMMINEYVGEMTVVLERNKGTVDKWIGDGIMAFWNAPLSIKNHPYWAVKASFQCERRLEYLMREWSAKGLPEVRIRHGFHMGEACVGNIGGEGRMSFTAIGESVNIAARIESLNKRYGTYRLCTEPMYQHISSHFLCRLMEMVAVKGTTKLIKVYEIVMPLEHCTDQDKQRVALYSEATEAFISGRDGFTHALSLYTQYEERYGAERRDVGLELMIRQCKALIQDPPELWTGGLIMEEK